MLFPIPLILCALTLQPSLASLNKTGLRARLSKKNVRTMHKKKKIINLKFLCGE